MKIEESKKEMNKLLASELLDIIVEFINKLKFESIFSVLYFCVEYKSSGELGNSIGNAIVYMIFFTILRRLPKLMGEKEYTNFIKRFNRLDMYWKLRLELKDNLNRFENISKEQLEEELNKLLKLRYN